MPSSTAVVSLPPLPSVVVFPPTVFPRKPHTTGTLPAARSGRISCWVLALLSSTRGFASRCLSSVITGQYGVSGSTITDCRPNDASAAATRRALVFSPEERSSSRRWGSISGFSFLDSAMIWSVTPFIAETTTTTPSPLALVSLIKEATWFMAFSFSRTDPPNLTTTVSNILVVLMVQDAPADFREGS